MQDGKALRARGEIRARRRGSTLLPCDTRGREVCRDSCELLAGEMERGEARVRGDGVSHKKH